MEKSVFCVLIKHYFLMAKNTVQAKQRLDKYHSDSALLETIVKRCMTMFKVNMIVQTQMMLNTQLVQIWQLSWKTSKTTQTCFG